MSGTYHVLGLMSGSSLDGLDLAFCRFVISAEASRPVREWELLWGKTHPFSPAWQRRLRSLPGSSGLALIEHHAGFGRYLAECIKPDLDKCEPAPDLIASHGHTLFHHPEAGFTFQLGDGAALAAGTGYPVISDFRSQDVALGGQGAPLAPLADLHLFPGYDFYLNLGGIANISAPLPDGRMVAFDIGGANQVLNALVEPLDMPYDDGGRLAAKGKLEPGLMRQLDALPYFKAAYPKSLGNDWVREKLVEPYLAAKAPVEDKLHTACRQLAGQTAKAIRSIRHREALPPTAARMLVTGGGAFNRFLLSCMEKACRDAGLSISLVLPGPNLISFKEAALMALMGALRAAGLPNCLASVTGARRDACGGALHQP